MLVLEQLWRGNISPADRFVKRGSEYQRISTAYCELIDKLLEGFQPQAKEQWEQDLDYTLFLALLRKLDFARGQFEKRMEDYSQGQKKKVLIAGSLCTQAHLYIWDEPLNYIDVFSRMQIENLILEFQPTMLLVEHDKTFVDKIGTNVKKL